MDTAARPALLGGPAIRPQGPPTWPPDDPAVHEAAARALADGSWGRYHGPHGPALVERLAAAHGCDHAILCASGTAAVELALRGAKVGPGDEVILAAYDFKGNFADVLSVGATPVLVDIAPDGSSLDVEHLPAAIGPATRAILVSHLHGGIAAMPPLMEIARAHGLTVIEDACQMPGAVVHGRPAGLWGDVGVLSFGGSKLLTAGRGGAVLTSNADIAQRIRLYTQRGNEAYPLSELQAALLLPQLDQLSHRNRHRAAHAARLCGWLAERPGLVPLHNPPSDSEPGYYKLGLWYDPAAFGGLPRDLFAQALRAEGIALDPGFRALHRTHSPRRYRRAGALPHAERADERLLTLHHPILLGGESDLRQIVAAIDRIRHHAAAVMAALG